MGRLANNALQTDDGTTKSRTQDDKSEFPGPVPETPVEHIPYSSRLSRWSAPARAFSSLAPILYSPPSISVAARLERVSYSVLPRATSSVSNYPLRRPPRNPLDILLHGHSVRLPTNTQDRKEHELLETAEGPSQSCLPVEILLSRNPDGNA